MVRASFRAVYGIADPAELDWDEMHDLLWSMPEGAAVWRSFRSLLAREEGDPDAMPDEGPRTMTQARNLFDRIRTRKRGQEPPTYHPFAAIRSQAPNPKVGMS